MKHYIILGFLLIIIPFSIMSQVPINDALLNKSEMLKLKWKFVFTNSTLRKTSFGPYATVDIRKGKQHLVGRQHEDYLDIKGKNVSMKRSVSTIKSQPFSLIILQDGADTIISNLDLTTVKGGDHALLEVGNSKTPEEENITSYCDDVMVQVKTDSLNWRMPATDDQHADYNDYPLSFDRVLTNGVDKIYVQGADGFPVKRRMYENHTKGIVFVYNKKQLAALETYPETTIWFSNDIKANHKQVIAAVIISLLSTSSSVMK